MFFIAFFVIIKIEVISFEKIRKVSAILPWHFAFVSTLLSPYKNGSSSFSSPSFHALSVSKKRRMQKECHFYLSFFILSSNGSNSSCEYPAGARF